MKRVYLKNLRHKKTDAGKRSKTEIHGLGRQKVGGCAERERESLMDGKESGELGVCHVGPVTLERHIYVSCMHSGCRLGPLLMLCWDGKCFMYT